MLTHRQQNHLAHVREGSALVLALVTIAMLSLSAYMFSEFMVTEYKATDTYARQLQAQMWAESGVEYVAALLTADGGGWDEDLYDNPPVFHVPLVEGGGFSIVAPIEDLDVVGASSEKGLSSVRYGLIDEAAKMNVNTLALFDPDADTGRSMLMTLPRMTEDIADAILDWIDSDDEQRAYGAELIDYDTTTPRNGAIDSLEELLFVYGVTPELLYGEDANRNGILDPRENDGDTSLPWDNEDGILDRGWSAYLTVHSKEANFRHAYERFGEERINVNEPLLTELFDILEPEYGTDIAQFITAYRLYGPSLEVALDLSDDSSLLDSGDLSLTPFSTSENPLNGVGSGTVTSSGDLATDEAVQRLATGMAAMFGGGGESITRGGMDLSSGAIVEIRSIYDLIDAEVNAVINDEEVTLVSPWSSDPGELQATLPILLDELTVTSNPVITGRININQASREVLSAIPEMPTTLPDAIIASRSRRLTGGASPESFATTGWLLIEGLVDLPTMRAIDGFITTRGEVFGMQSLGHADRGGPVVRIEAIIDATEEIPRIRMMRNLSELGPGFRVDDLAKFSVE